MAEAILDRGWNVRWRWAARTSSATKIPTANGKKFHLILAKNCGFFPLPTNLFPRRSRSRSRSRSRLSRRRSRSRLSRRRSMGERLRRRSRCSSRIRLVTRPSMAIFTSTNRNTEKKNMKLFWRKKTRRNSWAAFPYPVWLSGSPSGFPPSRRSWHHSRSQTVQTRSDYEWRRLKRNIVPCKQEPRNGDMTQCPAEEGRKMVGKRCE